MNRVFLRHHSYGMFNVLLRSFDTMKRNISLVLPVVFTLGLFLLLVNVFIFVGQLAENTLEGLSGKLTFTVYLKNDANFIEVKRLIDELEKQESVEKPVLYTSSETAKKTFGSLGIVDFPATLKITPKNPEDLQKIRSFIGKSPYRGLIENSTAEEKTFEKVSQELIRLQVFVKNILFLIFFITIVTGLFMLFALLKLETHARKTEMFVMKLVGAPTHALEMPFVAESVSIAIFGWIFGVILTLLLPSLPFVPFDPVLESAYKAMPFANVLILELFIMFVVGTFAGFLFLSRINRHKHAPLL